MSFHSPYRWCIVPNCNNTTLKTPEKLFIKVPNDINMRNVWLELAGRDPSKLSPKSLLHLCEDHFDFHHSPGHEKSKGYINRPAELNTEIGSQISSRHFEEKCFHLQEDKKRALLKTTILTKLSSVMLENVMENYMEYKIMGSVKQIRLKPHCTPSRFYRNEQHKSYESYIANKLGNKEQETVQDHKEENIKAIPHSSEDSRGAVDVSGENNKFDNTLHGSQVHDQKVIQKKFKGSQRTPMPCKDVTAMPTTCNLDSYAETNLITLKKSNISSKETMSAVEEEDTTALSDNMCEIKTEPTSECRTCLQTLNSDEDLHYIFQHWASPWEGVEDTIADALQRITQVQLSHMDPHSKFICGLCCQKLHTACLFATLARQSDYALRQRCPLETKPAEDDSWPKPIQIDKNIPFHGQIQIKEELSEEEYNNDSRLGDVDAIENDAMNSPGDTGAMDIKIEPVELTSGHQNRSVQMNGHYEEMSSEAATPEVTVNGEEKSSELCSVTVKEEPVSDNESAAADLSLDCLLCTKVFKSVGGLKAHVIAQHSYKTVRRKEANEPSPVKRRKHEHACATCRRTFATRTDLMVHETCHNMSVCYACDGKFDSFASVMRHRRVCAAAGGAGPATPRTLAEMRRPRRPSSTASEQENAAAPLQCTLCGESFTDNYYMSIHLEIHHSAPADGDVEVEALESLFTERA